MCQYMKDDGKQCNIDTEPFCHHHEDTIQAKLWRRVDEKYEDANLRGRVLPTFLAAVESVIEDTEVDVSEALSDSSGDSSFGTMDTTCDQCQSRLRRTERLTAHPNFDGRLLFEAVVECDCSEHVLGAQSVVREDVPDGWSP